MKKFTAILIMLMIGLSACRPNDDTPPENSLFTFESGEGYFILNEGGFGKANASVSYKFLEGDSIIHQVFQLANGRVLGDVLNSGTKHEESLYLVLNNSGIIKKVDIPTFEETAEISGLTSPRYMQVIDDTKAYVSDLFANKLWVVELQTNSIADSIEIGSWTEEMVKVNNKVYISSPTTYGQAASRNVFVIDSETDQLVETLTVGNNPVNMVLDNNGWLHVFCQGDPFADPIVNPSIYSINTTDHQDIRFKNIPNLPVAYHSRMQLSENQEIIYLLYGAVYDVNNLDNGLSYSSVPLIESTGRNYYGIGLSPHTGNIHLLDAIDYNQMGTVYEYRTNAVSVENYAVGVIPSHLIWY